MNELPIEGAPKGPETITDKRTLLAGMYRNWYLEYASYVILERAVPHIEDGLKPVQRRILHSMKTIDDGHFNKVANIVGNTMQYHPHGDASIGDALVQLGQKKLLVDTQGNWGNILTGDRAAASRYIEARLSEFAMEAVFSEKITEWMPTYDGRKNEPVTLPIKFPLLLVQGVEGIAVGLSSKILPHNFNEVADAAIASLKGEEFSIYPDFPTGGLLDASRYSDGARGGSVKVRAKIEKIDNKTLSITEIPFGKTTPTLITSILAAMDKGKIKIRKVDDNTSKAANIIVHLVPGTSSDKAIDALYAFTDCEVNISPNCCVIRDKKPHFLSVSDVVSYSANHTRDILRRELEIKLSETREAMMQASLEKIFIEERIYKDKEIEAAPDMLTATAHVRSRIEPFAHTFVRPVTDEDIEHLWEIKMARILRFNAKKAEERIAELDARIKKITNDLDTITDYTIRWFEHLKEKYGDQFPRRTQLRSFDSIEATKVAEANKRLYFDREGGFVGTALRDNKFLFMCSDLDDIIVFYRDGSYKVMRVKDKLSVGKRVEHIGLFKKGDQRMVYNAIYRNGKDGFTYKKRFRVTGITRDKDYNFTQGLPGTKVEWFSSNPNGEAEVIKVHIADKPDAAGRKPRTFDIFVDFADLAIKGRDALGNLVTKYEVESVKLEEKGTSTLGGREVWFDRDVLRLNYDGRGQSLGIFQGDEKILVINKDGEFRTTTYSDSNHYADNLMLIEKFDPEKVWTLVLDDATQGFPYIKRFCFEDSARLQRFAGSDSSSKMILLSSAARPRFKVEFGGDDASRPPLEIDAESFIGVKSFKAKGKRVSNFNISSITELEPFPAPAETLPDDAVNSDQPEEAEPEIGADMKKTPEAIQGDLFSDSEA